MKFLSLVSLLLLVGTFDCFAETLWFWDFTEEPAGWYHGSNWDYSDTGALLHIDWDNPNGTDYILTTSLTSSPLSVPASAAGKDLHITFYQELDYLNAVFDTPLWTDIEARVILNGNISYAFAYNGYVLTQAHYWDSLFTTDSGEKHLILESVQEGDQLSFEFYFYTKHYAPFYYGFVNWIITDLQVADAFTNLSRRTWAEIKATF